MSKITLRSKLAVCDKVGGCWHSPGAEPEQGGCTHIVPGTGEAPRAAGAMGMMALQCCQKHHLPKKCGFATASCWCEGWGAWRGQEARGSFTRAALSHHVCMEQKPPCPSRVPPSWGLLGLTRDPSLP